MKRYRTGFASDDDGLQADVMRFLAIIAFVLIASKIFYSLECALYTQAVVFRSPIEIAKYISDRKELMVSFWDA